MKRINLFCPAVGQAAVAFLFMTFSVSAEAGGKAHAAHEHGVATVNVVGEGNSLTIQLEAPADSIYGFEREAKSPDDIKKRDAGVDKLKASADKMFLPDGELKCKAANVEVKPFVIDSAEATETASSGRNKSQKGSHGEVQAIFKFECSKPVAGTKLKFAVGEFFKSIRSLKVQVLSGNLQEGSTIKNDKGSVNL